MRIDAGAKPSPKRSKKKKQRRARSGGQSGDNNEMPPVLTASDKKMIWKGPKIVLPTRQMNMDSEGGGRPLRADEINAAIADGSQPILDCIGQARGEAALNATLTLEMLIDERGKVTDLRMHAPRYLFEQGFASCCRKAARRLRFVATGAHTVATVPFSIY